MIVITKPYQREIEALPVVVREDLADALARLDEGLSLSMPFSRPMPSIGRGVHELRLRDRSGIYRVVYVIREHRQVLVIHAFKKTSQQTSRQAIEVTKRRIKDLGL